MEDLLRFLIIFVPLALIMSLGVGKFLGDIFGERGRLLVYVIALMSAANLSFTLATGAWSLYSIGALITVMMVGGAFILLGIAYIYFRLKSFRQGTPNQSWPRSRETNFDLAPLIQFSQGGRTTWQPTPVVPIGPAAPLTKHHVSLVIDAPERVECWTVLGIRVDVSNNHASKTLVDRAILDIILPTGAIVRLGPDSINLQPNGDTVALHYLWRAPHLKGNYALRFYLLNLRAETTKALAVGDVR